MLTHIGTNTIETERLVLRRFEYTDDDAMLRNWIADEKIQSLYSEPVYTTKAEVKELLDKYISSYEKKKIITDGQSLRKIQMNVLDRLLISLLTVKIILLKLNIVLGQIFSAEVMRQRLPKQ